jgi:hypothetical protein
MKMIFSSLNLVRKVGVCITSAEIGESKLTSEENLFNTTQHEYNTTSMGGPSGRDLNLADLAVVSEECYSSFHHPTVTAPERHTHTFMARRRFLPWKKFSPFGEIRTH